MRGARPSLMRGARPSLFGMPRLPARVAASIPQRTLCSGSSLADDDDFTQFQRFAQRFPVGTSDRWRVVTAKHGAYHRHRLSDGSEAETLAVGKACSEIFSGPRLANCLAAGLAYEMEALQHLIADKPGPSLSLHTSAGVTSAHAGLVRAIRPHLPWKLADGEAEDWLLNLQMEGASAVWAACDMLIQRQRFNDQHQRTLVAVGRQSYHGPGSSSLGSSAPLGEKQMQLMYPVPTHASIKPGESWEAMEQRILLEFEGFLDEHSHNIAVILVEPQWGSSAVAQPWNPALLRQYITLARERGIYVCADEIMCGLGRHGHGSLFLSEAWGLEPDAVTFGKAVATGAFPLSGSILRQGANQFADNASTAFQSHTYAGSSVRALMAASAVLEQISNWHPEIARKGELCASAFEELANSSGGKMLCQGQGLMWGGMWLLEDPELSSKATHRFKELCHQEGVWPYFVPIGFMFTPCYDIEDSQMLRAIELLSRCAQRTVDELQL